MNVFSANVKDIKSFKSLLSIVKDIVIDTTLIITKNGINLTSLNNSKNILLHFELPYTDFSDYICLVDKIIITTGSQYLYKIISKISNKSNLNLCIKDEDYIDFNVRFLTLNIDNTLIKIKLHENPSTENELPISNSNKNKTRFVMKSDDIHHIVKNMELISDHIKILVELDQVHFYCFGQYAESHVIFPNHIKSIEMDSIFVPISILKSFTKCSNLTDELNFEFGHGIPFSISYKINDLGNLSFFYKNSQSI